jgi:uncharacterized membrane protein YsdA (DUF1294 family)
MPAGMLSYATPVNLIAALAAINLIAFAAFGIDKDRAKQGEWRIKESTLLGLALIGGTVGAYAGRKAFRHKTRKQPFSGLLHMIAVMQLAALAAWLWWPDESAALLGQAGAVLGRALQ